MQRKTHRALGVLAGITALVTLMPQQNLLLEVTFYECIGKTYGSPGCPLISNTAQEESEKIVPENCGDMVTDAGEECDEGRFNGLSYCSQFCEILYCGDGSVDDVIGEECEPQMQEVYVLDEESNELATQLQFREESCGTVCTIPVCDDEGNCNTERCTWKFLDSCEPESESDSIATDTNSDLSIPSSVEEDSATKENADSTSIENVVQDPTRFAAGTCGNAVIDTGEECDDGNRNNFDTCPNDCTRAICGDGMVEGQEECDDSNRNNFDACPNDCSIAICGDGVREGTEQCDDGNFYNKDDCPNTCKTTYCGNNVREGREECDDGNQNNFDECPNDCILSVCGDGHREGKEHCDDGNRIDSDSCTNECHLAQCGDGMKQEAEECDDGNSINTDSCTNDCTISICGDSIVQANEECDDGNSKDTDSCPNTCKLAVCGNGDREGLEECDDGNSLSDDGCTPECVSETVCGDSILEGIEECDLGLSNSDSLPNTCRSTCELPYCGDGVIDDGEQCDGGKDCNSECVSLSFVESNPGSLIGGTVITSVAIIGGLMLFYRKKLMALSAKAAETVSELSIDDIPLDELEMPWHKWDKKQHE